MTTIEELLLAPSTSSSVFTPEERVDLPSPVLLPTLGGDSDGESDPKEDSAGDPLGDGPGVVRSSQLNEDSLKRLRKKCDFPEDIESQVPLPEERLWSTPPGWICLYSLYFAQSKLWFPLLRLLTSYDQNRDVAISQMSPAATRNMVVALVLGAEVDVDVDAGFFEAIS